MSPAHLRSFLRRSKERKNGVGATRAAVGLLLLACGNGMTHECFDHRIHELPLDVVVDRTACNWATIATFLCVLASSPEKGVLLKEALEHERAHGDLH